MIFPFIKAKLEPRKFKNNLTMFESKLILKLPPFFLTYTVREKSGNFKMSLISNIVRLFLNFIGSSLPERKFTLYGIYIFKRIIWN